MKSLLSTPLLTLTLGSLSAPAQGAVIMASTYWTSLADGPYYGTTQPFLSAGTRPAAETSMSGYEGPSGGQVTIDLNMGETVISAKMIASAVTITGTVFAPVEWNMVLYGNYPAAGYQAGDQVWYTQQQHWAGFFTQMDWKSEIMMYFEVVTNQGTFVDDNGGTGYLIHYGSIPEGSTVTLGLFGLAMAARRRRW
ncbi:hypothetical protein [Luteolibacter soli]|uniref:PEP-CTERM protein-sorting domain-containing protein n=1 Tax=Luteolibacter soli TaxID=3135280 RepID=A0ABU9AYD7_9BACT